MLIGSGIDNSAGFAVAPSEDGEGSVTISATFVRGVGDVNAQGEANPDRPADDPDDRRDTIELIVAIPTETTP